MPLAGEILACRPVVVIIGPTAVGKTDTAIQVAQALDGEIISADSRQVYHYMDIGTAKPTAEQRAAMPHYLIDVVTPDQFYTAVDFQTQAATAIEDIHARGKLPLIVGGTGQYISGCSEQRSNQPGTCPAFPCSSCPPIACSESRTSTSMTRASSKIC